MSHAVESRRRPLQKPTRSYHRQRMMVKKLTLLNRLVRSSIFQFLVGNLNWKEIGKPRDADPDKQYHNVKQSLHEQMQDLLIFGVLLSAAPFYAFNRFLNRTLLKSYWAKFTFGVLCGCGCLYVVYAVLSTLIYNVMSR